MPPRPQTAGRIAGVDNCVLWRIGFTGELSYELHVPAGYGRHVWEALLATGKLHLDPVITHRLKLLEFAKAMELLQSGDAIKVVLRPE